MSALIVYAFIAAGLAAVVFLVDPFGWRVPAVPPGPPFAGKAIPVDDLLLSVGDLVSHDLTLADKTMSNAKATLFDSDPASPDTQLRAATALTRLVSAPSISGLPVSGRSRVFELLGSFTDEQWNSPGWEEARAGARRAYAVATARIAANETDEPVEDSAAVAMLENAVVLPAEPKRVYIHFPAAAPSIQMSWAQAEAARSALKTLNWDAPGTDDIAGLKRVNEIRYGREEDAGVARKAMLDLRFAGFPVSDIRLVPAIGNGPLEAWMSAPPVTDPWKENLNPPFGWCFQRLGPVTKDGPYSLRCHRDAQSCNDARGADIASRTVRKSECRFIAELDHHNIQWAKGWGTADSYYRYFQAPLGLPFPSID